MSFSNEILALNREITAQVSPIIDYYENDPMIFHNLLPWLKSIPKTERYLNTRRMAEWILDGSRYMIHFAGKLAEDITDYTQARERQIESIEKGRGDYDLILEEQEKLYMAMNVFTDFLGCSKTTTWYIKLVEMNMVTHYDLQDKLNSILQELQYLCDYVNRLYLFD